MKTSNTNKAQTDCSHILQVFTKEMDSSYEKNLNTRNFLLYGELLSLKIFIAMFYKLRTFGFQHILSFNYLYLRKKY